MPIISFSQAIEKRNAPDADCMSGEHYRYSMAYELDGREYSFDIWAGDNNEAERHCRAIRAGVSVCGQIVAVDYKAF